MKEVLLKLQELLGLLQQKVSENEKLAQGLTKAKAQAGKILDALKIKESELKSKESALVAREAVVLKNEEIRKINAENKSLLIKLDNEKAAFEAKTKETMANIGLEKTKLNDNLKSLEAERASLKSEKLILEEKKRKYKEEVIEDLKKKV